MKNIYFLFLLIVVACGTAFGNPVPPTVVSTLKSDDIMTKGPTVDPRAFGAHSLNEPGFSSFDSTVAINAAVSYATAHRLSVVISGKYKITSTVTVTCPIKGHFGDGVNTGTLLLSAITNGSPVLDTSGDYWSITDIFIDDIAQSSAIGNWSGLRAGNRSGLSYSNRFNLSNVHVRHAAKGYDLRGYIGTGSNIFADFCTIGGTFDTLNGVTLTLNLEGNQFGATFTNCDATTVYLMCEAMGATPIGGVTVDGGTGFTLMNPYFEFNRDSGGVATTNLQYALRVGTTTQVNNFSMICGSSLIWQLSDFAMTFDHVNGLSVQNHGLLLYNTASGLGPYLTTNARNVTSWDFALTGNAFLNDDSLSLRPLINYAPNPNWENGISGWKTIADINSTHSAESLSSSPNLRAGHEALRITANSGVTSNSETYLTVPSTTLATLAGRTIYLGAWVYIPNIAHYAMPSGGIAPLMQVNIELNDGFHAVNSSFIKARPGHWNYFEIPSFSVNAAATILNVGLYPVVTNTGVTDGSEYITVSSIILTDAPASQERAAKGVWTESETGRYLPSPTFADTDTLLSGARNFLQVTPTILQGGTAGYTALYVNSTETSVGSGTKWLANFAVGGSSKASISNVGTGVMQSLYLNGGTVSANSANGTLQLGNTNFTSAGTMVLLAGNNVTATSGAHKAVVISPVYNETGTTANSDLVINRTETSVGSGIQNLIDLQVNSNRKWSVDHLGITYQVVGGAVPSGSTIIPTSGLFHVTGTAAISTISLPSVGYTGCLRIVPDGVFTTSTSGNIAVVSTAVVNKVLEMCYDGSKWYPSY